ncbi:hypothetical protein QJS10_CPB18g01129 [Acorus calamus]|uniref:Uncharacterized protein n=1 Tax=Acorus calamus TaxID=4465 RepID=A0AAV9CSB8_ACOCL|nr:hypothetical protein QJS10_CPB18g01129 [Acorus calamus]
MGVSLGVDFHVAVGLDKLSVEEIEPRLIELQHLREGASAPVESESEEQINEDSEEDESGESEKEETDTTPSAQIEIDIEIQNTEGGDNVRVENGSGEDHTLMEEDCGRQFQQFDSTEGEGIYNSNQSPDDAQKTPTSQALEKEITELKRTMAAYEIDMLRIMADNNSKSFRLNTGARNIKCLFKKCCSLRRKIRSLNEQIVKLKNLNTKLKNKVSQKEDDIKGYKEREKNMSVIGKQKKIISDMEDDASVHDITQKTALNAEITCLKQQIVKKIT